MATLKIDTLKFSSLLKSSGLSEEQSHGITEAIQTIDLEYAASREDVLRLDKKIEQTKSEILRWMFGGFFGVITMLAGILFKISTLPLG